MRSELDHSAASALRVQVRRGGIELTDELRNEWLRMCEADGCDTPYNRPEYFAAYVRAFEPRSRNVIVTVRMDGNLVGILPLVEAVENWFGIPVRLLTTPRDAHYAWYDLICKSAIDPNKMGEAILQELNRMGGWDVLRLLRVADGSSAHKLLHAGRRTGLRAHSILETSVAYVTIDSSKSDFEGFLCTRKSKFRYNLRRAFKKAEESGGVSIHRYETADPGALRELYRVESAGWKGKGGTAISCIPHELEFYNDAAKAAADHGYFRLYLLNLGSRTIAGMYAYQLNGVLSFPKIGYDEEFKHLAPGHLIVHEVLKECWRIGLREFDFLGSIMSWKEDWTSESRKSWSLHFYRNTAKCRLLEKIRFSLLPIARKVYRRVRPREPAG